jgi:hypothetical protein
MARYMMLIYVPSGPMPESTPEEAAAQHAQWDAYTESLRDAGVWMAGDQLADLDTATTVRERGGELQITDGPFAETKEWLAGFYMIDCPDLDTALKHAARIPSATYGSTEVRPIVEVPAAAQA